MINPLHNGESRDWCSFVRERLELFLDGELLGSENLAFLTHLKECDECASYWADDEAVSRRLMVALGDVTEVGAAPSHGPRPSDRRARPVLFPRASRTRGVLLTAAFVAVVSGAYWLGGRRGETGEHRLPVVQTNPEKLAVVWAQGGPLERRKSETSWRAIDRGDAIMLGSEVSAPANADLVIGAGPVGSLVISSESRVRITEPSSGEFLSMDLISGKAAVDIVDRGFSLRLGTVVVSGWSAACTLAVASDETCNVPSSAEVAVMRGSVNVQTVCGTRTIGAGQSIDCLSGVVQPISAKAGTGTADTTGIVASANVRVAQLQALIEKKDRRLEELQVGIRRLEEEVRKFRGSSGANGGSDETPDAIVREYLQTVELSNHVEIDPPNGFARSAMARLEGFGTDVVFVLQEFLVRETSEQKKRAILGLVYGLKSPESVEVLKRATGDVTEDVRRTALRLLIKIENNPSLAEHFLAVERSDASPELRTLAAYGAARLGDETGFTALVTKYYESKACEKTGVLSLILRLEKQPAVAAFMHRILRDWTPAESPMSLRMVVKKVGDMHDVEALPLLRDLGDRQGLPQELKKFIDAVADTLHLD